MQELFRFLQFYTIISILIDINECEVGGANDCHTEADCLNIDGSYNCTCKVGYTGTGILCAGILFKNLYEQMMTVLYCVSSELGQQVLQQAVMDYLSIFWFLFSR